MNSAALSHFGEPGLKVCQGRKGMSGPRTEPGPLLCLAQTLLSEPPKMIA